MKKIRQNTDLRYSYFMKLKCVVAVFLLKLFRYKKKLNIKRLEIANKFYIYTFIIKISQYQID